MSAIMLVRSSIYMYYVLINQLAMLSYPFIYFFEHKSVLPNLQQLLGKKNAQKREIEEAKRITRKAKSKQVCYSQMLGKIQFWHSFPWFSIRQNHISKSCKHGSTISC